MPEELPPFSPEAERATLGSMLIESWACKVARLNLNANDFYSEKNRNIFTAAVTLSNNRAPVDFISVAEELKSMGVFGDSGGTQYLKELGDSVGTTKHVEHYSKIVRQKSLERQVAKQFEVARLDKTPENVTLLGRLISESGGAGERTIFDFRKDLAGSIDGIIEGRTPGIPTGFKKIDECVGGFEEGTVWTIGARTGGCKTATMTRMALNVADFFRRENYDESVLYITTEMTQSAMIERVLPVASGVPLWKIKKGNLTKQEHGQINDACSKHLSKLPLKLYDHPSPNIDNIRDAITKSGSRIVFLDYLQRCQYPKADNRAYEIQKFMVALTSFAQDAGVMICQGCQLDRGLDKQGGRPPVLADLRDSGAIEHESHVVILLNRKENKDEVVDEKAPVLIEGAVAKARNGKPGKFMMELNGELIKIAEEGESTKPLIPEMGEPGEDPDDEDWMEEVPYP